MKPTRRGLLAGGAALIAGCTRDNQRDSGDTGERIGADWRDAEPERWEPEEPVDLEVFAWGLRISDATTSTALVSVRSGAESVEVRVAEAGGEGWTVVHSEETAETVLKLSGLVADTAYNVVLVADGVRSETARFRTAISSSEDRLVVIGATSCLGATNKPWPCLSHAALEDLDVFLLLGDTIYADSSTYEGYTEEWGVAVEVGKGLYDLQLSTSFVHTWDDHEVANNWYEGDNVTTEWVENARNAYRDHLPWEGSLYRVLSWGNVVDLIVLDSRGERIRDERYLSPEQMAWLKETLSSSQARFKVILNSVPVTDLDLLFGTVERADRWMGYQADRDEILEYVDSEGIPGVVWVAGDLHYGALNYVGKPGEVGADQFEVMAGPAGSRLNPLPGLFEGDDQFPILLSTWNYVRLECDPVLGTVFVRFIGDDGAVLAEQELAI